MARVKPQWRSELLLSLLRFTRFRLSAPKSSVQSYKATPTSSPPASIHHPKMWPFGSSPSPSVAPLPLGRPLTNSEAVDPKLNPLNPEGLKPYVALLAYSFFLRLRPLLTVVSRSFGFPFLLHPCSCLCALRFIRIQMLRLPRDQEAEGRLLPAIRLQRRRWSGQPGQVQGDCR